MRARIREISLKPCSTLPGFGATIHVGEEGGAYGIAEIREVVSTLRPDRIGHGILAAQDEKLMTQIGEAEIVLEICPTSNLLTKALPDEDAVRATFCAFAEHGVPFTIATDGPEMMRTHLRDEFELLLIPAPLTRPSSVRRTGRHEASFVQTSTTPQTAWIAPMSPGCSGSLQPAIFGRLLCHLSQSVQ